ncbi:PLP-dependent transferase [Violaceomyces palustris]|uniref:PLP-dependent transferase n=1 Tax=Violaceomyces palustris TaxID=1673888 RepID=A0ACD0NPV7_9BASI|nr:PLP-dependent transferase [Violaceomyces palustris]
MLFDHGREDSTPTGFEIRRTVDEAAAERKEWITLLLSTTGNEAQYVHTILAVFRDLFDPDANPNGIVNLGIADNSLCRQELIKPMSQVEAYRIIGSTHKSQYFNQNRLSLSAPELTYPNRVHSSARLLDAICHLVNDVPNASFRDPSGVAAPKPFVRVKPEHIAVGPGATSVLDTLFWCLCNAGDGVLMSVPYYNGFDHDLTFRSEAVILPVQVPTPTSTTVENDSSESAGSGPSFAPDTIKFYVEAYQKAVEEGISVKAILVVNPHNPTGGIYPRETLVELAKFAAEHKLHLVVDEIYAKSCYQTSDSAKPPSFHSILSIDVEGEAALPPSQVHVVTSASKDFGINGFRLGVLISQRNKDLMSAMTGLGILYQSSAPAGALWYTWLEDSEFLNWYLAENRRRLSVAYEYITDWFKHHRIPYVPANSGHFVMEDFSRFLKVDASEEGDEKAMRKAEAELVARMIEERVFVAPGSQYHHPIPGWFRLTFSQDPTTLKEGLVRLEKVLGLEEWIGKRPELDLLRDSLPVPTH